MNIFPMKVMSFCKRKKEKNNLRMTPRKIIERGDYLYHFSYWVYGLYYDMLIAKRSLNSTIIYEADGAYPVQSISYMYLREFLKKLEYDENDVFVDVGCAWGRIIGYLRRKTQIKKFYGVELNSRVAEKAKKYFEKDKNVEIISGDILKNIPSDGTIFYLFNPFDENIMSKFLDELEKRGTPVKVLYLYPTCEQVFEQHDLWKKESTLLLTPSKMGELELNVYVYGGNK